MAELNETLVAGISAELEKLNNKLIELDATYTKMLTGVQNANKALNTQAATTKTLSEAERLLKEEQKKLTDAEKEADKAAAALERQRQKGLAAMAKAEQKERDLQAAINKEVKSEQDLIDKNNALIAVRKRLDTTTDSGKKKHAELTAEIAKNTKELKSQDAQIGKSQRNVGNYSSAFDGLGGAMSQISPTLGRATSATQTFGKSLLKLLANPIVAIVAAIVAAFAGLVAVFKSTDDGGTKLDALFAALGATLDVLKRRAVILIDAFKALFSGNFREAGEKFKETVSDIGEELANTTKAAYDYVQALDAIKDRNIAMISEIAKTQNAIERLVSTSKDQTLSDQERLDALEEALQLEKSLAEKKMELLKESYQNELANQAAKANINKETLDNFIQLGEAEQTAARANNKELSDAWNVLGDDNIKALEEMYAAFINADTDYFRSTQRMVAQLSGFRKRLADEDKELATVRANEKIEELEIKATTELEIEQEKADGLLLIKQNLADNIKNLDEQEKQRVLEYEQAKRDAKFATLQAIQDIFGQETLIGKAALAIQKADAIQQNLISLGVITAKSAEGQAKSAAAAPFPFNIPLIAGTIVQFASILALFKKAKKYKEGTKGKFDTPDTFVTSEKGAGVEWIETRTGDLMQTDKPTLHTGMAGARVYSNKEVQAIIGHSPKNQVELDQLVDVISQTGKETVNAVKNIKTFIVDSDRKIYGFKRGNYKRTYL